jgi:hypothetical protein
MYSFVMTSLKNQSITPENIALVERTIRETMSAYIVESIDVQAGEDHDGDPVIFIEVRYCLNDEPIDSAVIAGLLSLMRDKLWAAGERRFPHTRHLFDERQVLKPRKKARA